MPNYRRIWIPGGTYFFTVALADRRSDILTTHIADLRAAFLSVCRTRPFAIDAIVVLPRSHPRDLDASIGRRRLCNALVSYQGDVLARVARERARELLTHAQARARNPQRRYWSRAIVDEKDFAVHVDYVHINLVKQGLVESARVWPWSSFHRQVREGVLAENVGGVVKLWAEARLGPATERAPPFRCRA